MLHRSQIRLSGATQTGNRKSSYDFLFLKCARGGGKYSQHIDEWYKPTDVRVPIIPSEYVYPPGHESSHDFMNLTHLAYASNDPSPPPLATCPKDQPLVRCGFRAGSLGWWRGVLYRSWLSRISLHVPGKVTSHPKKLEVVVTPPDF